MSDLVHVYCSSNSVQEEKRPWVLRANETSVARKALSSPEENITPLVPQTLIYISCGWESFKEVCLLSCLFECTLTYIKLEFSMLTLKVAVWQDCKSLLSSKAWYLEKAHGFNFFPGTQR